MSKLFGIKTTTYDLWQGKSYSICQTPSMDLFMGLQLFTHILATNKMFKQRIRPRQIEKFPYTINLDCKCKNCRYQRWRNK